MIKDENNTITENLIKKQTRIDAFQSPLKKRTQNLLIKSGIYSKADLILAFKHDIISPGRPRGIGTSIHKELLDYLKDDDIISDEKLFLSNFPIYIQNYLKRMNIQDKNDLFDFLQYKETYKKLKGRKKTLEILKAFIDKEMK